MMKKIKYILLFLAAGMISQSCSKNDEDFFDESAAQRMNEAVSKYTTLLENSEQGWVMDYYPSDCSYGGITHTISFKDGTASIATEEDLKSVAGTEYPAGTIFKSLYQVKGEQECILTFDTYNPLFHFWSEPKGSSSPNGYESDYEFSFKQISDDIIILKGKKYGNRMQLTRLKSPASEYIAKVIELEEKDNIRLELIINGKSHDCIMRDKQLEYTLQGETEEESEDIKTPFVYTDCGIRLYEPITVDGVTFQNFKINDKEEFVAEEADVVIPTATIFQLFKAGFKIGHLTIDFANDKASMDDNYWAIVKECKALDKSRMGEDMKEMYFGASISPSQTVYPQCIGWRSDYYTYSKYYVQYGISMKFNADNEMTVEGIAPDINYSYYSFFSPMVDYLLENSPYLSESETVDDVTKIKFTSKNNPSAWFSVEL